MKKYVWFFIGYFKALITIFLSACAVTPLEAYNDDIGSNQYNPLYVKIVE